MKIIKEITAKDTYLVRHPVLRSEKPIESCHFNGDESPTTLHLGLFDNEIVTAVVSVFENKNPIFKVEKQFQIRGMAVCHNHQRKGLGQILVAHCEQLIRAQFGQLIWFNARENAVPFYEKMNYEIVGTVFDIPEVGLHFLMKKKIG